MKILVLEDDPSLRLALHDSLEDMGHTVESVGTNTEAIVRVEKSELDLLIADLMIARRTSLGVISAAADAEPCIDVIVLTGTRLCPYGELFKAASNISWILRKPLKLRDLSDLVEFAEYRRSAKINRHYPIK